MSDLKKFYMVIGLGQGLPTVKHSDRAKAFSEAKRLAAKHPDTEYYVLETIARAVAATIRFDVFPDASQICAAAQGDWWQQNVARGNL